jgi:hypothetical protein
MKSQNIIVGFLVSSALVLALLLVLTPPHPQPANAAMTAVGRDYVLVTSEAGMGGPGTEYITVVDTRSLKMVTYQILADRGAKDHFVAIAAGNASRLFTTR